MIPKKQACHSIAQADKQINGTPSLPRYKPLKMTNSISTKVTFPDAYIKRIVAKRKG